MSDDDYCRKVEHEAVCHLIKCAMEDFSLAMYGAGLALGIFGRLLKNLERTI